MNTWVPVASGRAISLVLALFVLSSCELLKTFTAHEQITPEERINLGMAYERNKKLNEAFREYRIAAKQLPIAYLHMGNVCFQKDAFDEAEKYYKKAIQRTGDPRAYNNLAWLYYSEDIKLEAAEELAGKAVELAPDAQDFKDTLEKIIEKRLGIQWKGI